MLCIPQCYSTSLCEYIAQSAAEAATMAIQTMFMAGTSKTENKGPRINGPIMKKATSDWSVKDKYAEPANIKLEV